MNKRRAGWTNGVVNVMLVGLGLAVLVLFYALVSRNVSVDAAPEAKPAGLVGDIIQVEVRNGCGVAGLAESMTQFLRHEGFDVVEVGNYTSFNQAKTLVVDRVGDLEAAKNVAAAIGLSEDRVAQEFRQDYFLYAPVVIVQAYEPLAPFPHE